PARWWSCARRTAARPARPRRYWPQVCRMSWCCAAALTSGISADCRWTEPGSLLDTQAAGQQFAVVLQYPIGGSGNQMCVNLLDVAQHVELQSTRLGQLRSARA